LFDPILTPTLHTNLSKNPGLGFFILLYLEMRKIISGLALLAMLSCGKDDGVEPAAKISMTDAINGKSWKVSSIVLTSSDGAYLDLFNINFQTCERDDILQFKSDGVFVKTDGALVCNPPGASVFNNLNGGDWSLSTSDSTLRIAQYFNTQIYKVSEWSATNLTWKQINRNYLGFEEVITFKLIAPKFITTLPHSQII
jgi:hypothetical protein